MNGDVMGVLSSIMQDPKAMEQARSLARMLSLSGAVDGISENNSHDPSHNTDSDGATADAKNAEKLLSAISSDASESSVSRGSRVTMNERLALLSAIRPYLAPEKAQKLDSVIKILKIVSTLEKSGINLFS